MAAVHSMPFMPWLPTLLRKSSGRSVDHASSGPLERPPLKLFAPSPSGMLESRRAELADFDMLLPLLETVVEATAKLDPMLEHLASRRRGPRCPDSQEATLRLTAELDSWCSRMKGASMNLEDMQQEALSLRRRCEEQAAVYYLGNK